jgi:hypothetical protein
MRQIAYLRLADLKAHLQSRVNHLKLLMVGLLLSNLSNHIVSIRAVARYCVKTYNVDYILLMGRKNNDSKMV